MVNKRGRGGASAEAWRARKNVFSCFTCCSRRTSLCVHSVLDEEGHGAIHIRLFFPCQWPSLSTGLPLGVPTAISGLF